MKIKLFFTLLIFIMINYSCAPTINYLGKKYAPTTQVEIFFDLNDIQKEYTVMGKMENEASEFDLDDTESIQKAMIEKAKEVGADAILFDGMYKDKILGERSETRSNNNGEISRTNSSVNSAKVYTVTLIKYK